MNILARVLTGTALATSLFSMVLQSAPTFAAVTGNRIQHVLLISVDGFHAVDLEICVAKGTCPNLKNLTQHGFTYTNASTTKPSDSFPGLLAQLTGGTSKSTGVFYDDSYDRTLYAPGCTSGPGAEVNLAENTEKNSHAIDGGVAGSLTGLNAGVAIDPNNLPGQKVSGSCVPLWPHNFIRTNTVSACSTNMANAPLGRISTRPMTSSTVTRRKRNRQTGQVPMLTISSRPRSIRI
jgi:Type I phosphodiesterase / nucleotide pyrophosphatase